MNTIDMTTDELRIYVDEFLERSKTAWGSPTVDEMRPLSTFDIEAMWVAGRMDWGAVDLTRSARLNRGVRYLRNYYPQGRKHIDWRTLNIGDCGACVLGQLYGEYAESLEFDIYSVAWLVAHGFTGFGMGREAFERDARALTDRWQQIIGTWAGGYDL